MKKAAICLIILTQIFRLSAQDIHFSQFNETPLLINPALTGFFEGNHRISLNYKNQWRSINNSYNTYALSYDARIGKHQHSKSGFLAIGGNFSNDVSGDLNLTNLVGNIDIAYHLKISDEQLISAGLYGGFGQRSIESGSAQWGTQYDVSTGYDASLPSNETFGSQNFSYADFGFGLNWSMNHNSTNMSSNDGFKANEGFSVSHVNRPDFSFLTNTSERMNMRITAHAKALIGLSSSNTALVPMLMIQFQGTQSEFLPGMMVRYTLREQSKYTGFINDAYLSFGGLYRTSDAIIINSMIELNDFAIGLSYDINVSKLANATNGKGGFEIALRYIISNPNQNRSFY